MITLHHGSILDSTADYIVNPANGFLRHDGGLAKVIADAATNNRHPLSRSLTSSVEEIIDSYAAHKVKLALWRGDHERAPLIATGNSHMTGAGALPYRGVIHAVGPIWNAGHFMEIDLLEMAYESAFESVPVGYSVAAPAISAGIFGAPIDVVARIAVAVAGWYDHDIEFWLFSQEHYDAFSRELREV